MMPRTKCILFLPFFTILLLRAYAAEKSKLSLDDFFNAVDFASVQLSPDGHAVVIGTTRADWNQNAFRHDLWLYRDDATPHSALVQLTQSGRDSEPQWSPDGNWIAFLSERKEPPPKTSDSDPSDSGEDTNQVYLIAAGGGEAFPATVGPEEVHSFAWSPDSKTIYFGTRTPRTKAQNDAYRKEWKDTIQYRAAERGDTIFTLDVASAITRNQAAPTELDSDKGSPETTPGSRAIAEISWRVAEMEASHNGQKLAFLTTSVSERQEKVDEFEIYSLDLPGASVKNKPVQLTRNQAVEQKIHWSSDDRHIYFTVDVGNVNNEYRDLQPHLYWVDADNRKIEQWNSSFEGAVADYALYHDRVMVAGRLGTEGPAYYAASPHSRLEKTDCWPGIYARISTAGHSSRVALIYSSLDRPVEVYLADKEDLTQARPITSFNQVFTQRNLPRGKPYTWVADDGTRVEGMLIYPPGKFSQNNLPMFTFIHGGPADADGNHFEADWYQWDRLAATDGWLVFEPNYRGSSGYGDKFLMGIVPQIVSRPGKDILEGVDALVKDGIADRNRLTVGGYSYGGYMTNWLITQTTRFKAAVTGAGAVEHVGNWGNDDTTFDDAYFLGGEPWKAQQRYHDEAAIFQIDKVKTPTHIVAGASDIRVAVMEDYLLDHALHLLGAPSTLLIFPGEGHSLDKNPWHGKIKVREELRWLRKYGNLPE